MRRTLPITFVILSILLEPQAAHAYLDPGTGSMLLSVFVGLVSGVYFVIRKLPSTLRSLFFQTHRQNGCAQTQHIDVLCRKCSVLDDVQADFGCA